MCEFNSGENISAVAVCSVYTSLLMEWRPEKSRDAWQCFGVYFAPFHSYNCNRTIGRMEGIAYN